MDDRPEQRPEGRLIAVAQKRARLSGRKAADRAGMSEGHWRAIVSGYRSVSAGTWVSVRAPADTLAVMAQVVGVTPKQLESAGREDAAAALRELTTQPARPRDFDLDKIEAALAALREVAADPEASREFLLRFANTFGAGETESDTAGLDSGTDCDDERRDTA